jgi:hypothetical protein
MIMRAGTLASRVIGVIAIGIGLAQTPATAVAADVKFVVDDDGVECPNAGYTDIQSALDAAALLPSADNKKVVICAGTYSPSSTIDTLGMDNLTITGRAGAVFSKDSSSVLLGIRISGGSNVTLQNLSLTSHGAFLLRISGGEDITLKKLSITAEPGYIGGSMIDATGVNGLALQNVTIDGGGHLAEGVAVIASESNITIDHTKIIDWHSEDFTGSSQVLELYGSGSETATVTSSVFKNFGGNGIYALQLANLTVTDSKFVVVGENGSVGIVIDRVDGGTISGNRIEGTSFPVPQTDFGGSVGINVSLSNDIVVSDNVLTHWDTGLMAVGAGDCDDARTSSNVQLIDNTIREVGIGIDIFSTSSSCDSHADNYVITGNVIRDTLALGTIGIQVQDPMWDTPPHLSYLLNTTITNNKIVHFAVGMTSPLPNPPTITGVFAPNTVRP